jgi:hypothetical protein
LECGSFAAAFFWPVKMPPNKEQKARRRQAPHLRYGQPSKAPCGRSLCINYAALADIYAIGGIYATDGIYATETAALPGIPNSAFCIICKIVHLSEILFRHIKAVVLRPSISH